MAGRVGGKVALVSGGARGQGAEHARLLAEPREISYGVLYLASDESAFVTGIDLVIDGGFLVR